MCACVQAPAYTYSSPQENTIDVIARNEGTATERQTHAGGEGHAGEQTADLLAGRQVKGVGGKTNGAGDTDWHVSGYCKFKSTRRGHVKIGNKCYTHIHFVARPYLPAVSTKYRSSH